MRGGRQRHVAALAGGGYAGAVVMRLVELRRAGMKTFDRAWEYAMEEYPPNAIWETRQEAGQPAAIEFLREKCRREWEGSAGGARLVRPVDFD